MGTRVEERVGHNIKATEGGRGLGWNPSMRTQMVQREEQLPTGWKQAIDEGSGKPYYFNDLGECTWIRPTATVAALTTVPAPAPSAPVRSKSGVLGDSELTSQSSKTKHTRPHLKRPQVQNQVSLRGSAFIRNTGDV